MKKIVLVAMFVLPVLMNFAQKINTLNTPPKSEITFNKSIKNAAGQLIVNLPASAYMLCMVAR